MNILICGRQGGLCKQLADRLSREKSEIYYISGNKKDETLSKSVFQEYHFPYLNENINQIIFGTRPDTMIVTGAFDTNFSWRKAEKDAIEYVTGMTSLFMAAQNAGVRRLIYLSTTEVFENNKEEVIDTSVQPNADSPRLKAFARVESTLDSFNGAQSDSKMQIVILRLPPVFGDFSDRSTEFCLRSAVDYINTGKIHVSGPITHTGIHYRDAAEAVIRCVTKPDAEIQSLYQVRGLVFSEEELADTLIKTEWNKNAVVDRSEYVNNTSVSFDCPPARIDESSAAELGLTLRYNLQSACDMLCKECLKQHKEDEKAARTTIQILPIIESVVLSLITYFVSDWLTGTWVGNNLNLFLLYVLLLAVTYGTSHGLFASILAGFGLLTILTKESSFIEVASDYAFYLQFLQIIVTGVIAGYVRDKFARKNKGLAEEKMYLNAELSDLTRINDNNVYVKNIYEKRLLGYENSLSRIYELTAQLDFLESRKVTFHAVRVISELMDMHHVAIYTANSKSDYFRLSAATSDLAASCGKSIKFDKDNFLYETLSQKTVFINRDLTDKRPTFGGAVYSDNQLIAIILVWTNDLRQINLYESDSLAIACKLIEKSMSRAFLYEDSLRNDTYISGSKIMKTEYFLKILSEYEDGHSQGLLNYTVLKVLLNGHKPEEAAELIRDTDYVGIINETVCILLTSTSIEESAFVLKRLAEKGIEGIPVDFKLILAEAECTAIEDDSAESELSVTGEEK